MSQIEYAVTLTKRLESLLEKNYGAVGKGLHEKASNVETRLSPELMKSLRFIATIRNSVVHEDGFEIPDMDRFKTAGAAAIAELGGEPVGTPSSSQEYKVYATIAILLSMTLWGLASGWKFGGVVGSLIGAAGGYFAGLWIISKVRVFFETLMGLAILGCIAIFAVAVLSALFKH